MRQGKAWVKGQARRLDKGMSNFRGEGIRRTMTEQNKIEINHVGWEFSVEQDGMVVASGEAPTEESARREAAHYALMYSQDGPVKVSIKEVQGTPTVPRGGKAQDDCEVATVPKGEYPETRISWMGRLFAITVMPNILRVKRRNQIYRSILGSCQRELALLFSMGCGL